MRKFNLYREYKLEELAGIFGRKVYSAPVRAADLLTPHIVVVQTRGMGEYLRQYLAKNYAVAANLQMPFLNGFINSLLRRLYGSAFSEAEQCSDPASIRQQLMKLLCNSAYIDSRMPELAPYLQHGVNQELKRWQLAGKLADIFDQYQLYRADKLEDMFRKGSSIGSWQKKLYDELFPAGRPGRDHFFRQFLQQELSAEQKTMLPEVINIFGVGALPPVYLSMFLKLAEYTQVNFFYLTPCLEYWEDQVSQKEKPAKPGSWEEPGSGNPLVQALGRQGRCFYSALLNMTEAVNELEHEEKTPDGYPPGSSMLEIMQYDILYLFDRKENPGGLEFTGQPKKKTFDDRSISIHNCHNLRRELEVLQDELVRLIRQGTAPQDIIVMLPDVERCASLIHAVFGNGALRDVYSIADLPPDDSAMVSEAFHRLLAAADSHFEFSEIMALLDLEVFTRTLQLQDGDLAKMADYLQKADVRWGFDRNMRKKFCGCEFDEFSWQGAFERLLAGYACRRSGQDALPLMINQINTLEALDDSEIELFARLVRFVQNLAQLAGEISGKHPLEHWCGIFGEIISRFFAPLEDSFERGALLPLYRAVDALRKMAVEGCAPGDYPLNAALAMLDSFWENSSENGRFLHGKITFCRMTPMRSIPMQTVALLELNEGDFPRRSSEVGFDLLSAFPQAGDRSGPSQDRYLLLEALLSARKNLLFFYQGQNARDNSERPPCAPLGEIMSYLKNAFDLDEIKHKISGIDRMYYQNGSLCSSFDQENYRALLEVCRNYGLNGRSTKLPDGYVLHGLPRDVTMDLDKLIDFFSNPAKYFIRSQLGIYFEKNQPGKLDVEPFVLDPLGKWQVKNLLAGLRQQDIADQQTYEYARCSNMLPPGRIGRQEFEACCNALPPLPEDWRRILSSMERLPFAAELVWPESPDKLVCRVSGMVNITPDQRTVCAYRWGSYDARTALPCQLGVWLAAAATGQAVSGEMLNLSGSSYELRTIAPVTPAEAQKKLKAILLLAWQEHNGALAIFPKSSPWVNDLSKAKIRFSADGKYSSPGDIADEYVQHFFDKDSWLDEEFQDSFISCGQLLYGDIELRKED